jgi:hypothetical protein
MKFKFKSPADWTIEDKTEISRRMHEVIEVLGEYIQVNEMSFRWDREVSEVLISARIGFALRQDRTKPRKARRSTRTKAGARAN